MDICHIAASHLGLYCLSDVLVHGFPVKPNRFHQLFQHKSIKAEYTDVTVPL